MKNSFNSNGKLLLTGEYVVLGGATALAVPTKFGQSLEIEICIPANTVSERSGIRWESLDEKNSVWFDGDFEITNGQIESRNPMDLVSIQLLKILQEAKSLNPEFLEPSKGLRVKTKLDFPRNWGLGTSSTLINNIAQWAEVDPFKLLDKSFGGSGYDVAAAQNDSPILYKLKDGKSMFKEVDLPWDFTEHLFFVHLNQKQDSKEGIARYKNSTVDKKSIQQISDISKKLLSCTSLLNFENLMNLHEKIISEIIKIPSIKERLFRGYPHTIKSLGAWGGDFVLVTGTPSEMDYFREKGFGTILSFEEMIKSDKK